jgi:hypothetical protein
MALRECPYCGSKVYDSLTQCSHCRERLPELKIVASKGESSGGGTIRRGLLCMLLAGVIGYFASGSSALSIPVVVPRQVVIYLSPLLFLSGLGLSLLGLYQHFRHSH